MDIQTHFHLTEAPFRIGPDPRYLYFSDQVKEAIAKCEYMTRERIGPIYIYGPIGSGKTTLLRRLYERISQEEAYHPALLIAPNIKSSNAFLRLIMEEFAVPTDRSYDKSLKNFETFLVEQYQSGKIPVLLVDEAQNLTRDALKLIHYLLNYETATVKLLQIVLVGQEELATKILRYQELASRMFPIAINAMSPDEMRSMIAFRWMVAGGKEDRLPFASEEVYKAIFAYSKGLPRDAIRLCDETLRDLAFSAGTMAAPEQIERLARELNLFHPSDQS